jgi:DNA-directed RNA polymerase subunit RPC12/RpoP
MGAGLWVVLVPATGRSNFMLFRVSCENCGKSLKARSEFVGKSARCPKCNHKQLLRKPSELLDDIQDVGLAPVDEREEKERQQKERAADKEFESDGTFGLADRDE